MGAIVYLPNAYPCNWAFESPIGQGTLLNFCDAYNSLTTLARNIGNVRAGNGITEVFIGPNDCTQLITDPGGTISDAATKFENLVAQVNLQTFPTVIFEGIVDNEGYVKDPNGYCDVHSSGQYNNAFSLFSFYYSAGGIIGPAGTSHGTYTPAQEQNFAAAGAGYSVPQIYNTNNANLDWPTAIVPTYIGIETCPGCFSGALNASTAEWDWYQAHMTQHPPNDFDWSCPGSRC